MRLSWDPICLTAFTPSLFLTIELNVRAWCLGKICRVLSESRKLMSPPESHLTRSMIIATATRSSPVVDSRVQFIICPEHPSRASREKAPIVWTPSTLIPVLTLTRLSVRPKPTQLVRPLMRAFFRCLPNRCPGFLRSFRSDDHSNVHLL